MSGQSSRLLGRWGENLAAEELRKKGYHILAANWRCRFGEIDLIARNREYLCFIEVKLRKNAQFAAAKEFVTYQKQQKIRTTAQMYLMTHPCKEQPRFDVMEIYAPEGMETRHPIIHHIENAF